MGDTPTDKFTFKAKCYPPADGVTIRFFVGDTRLVQPNLDVFVGFQLLSPTAYVTDWARGTFDVSGVPAPAQNADVCASYYYQWFTDDELTQYLNMAANSVNVPTIDDPGLLVLARPSMLDFAAYYAYMYKAAEYASGLQGSAEGFTMDKSRPSPNWKALAQEAWDIGTKSLALATSNPMASKVPTMSFVAFQLPIYVPVGFR